MGGDPSPGACQHCSDGDLVQPVYKELIALLDHAGTCEVTVEPLYGGQVGPTEYRKDVL